MGRAHQTTRRSPKIRPKPSRYTPGTRLAEAYGMDLDREKREGRSPIIGRKMALRDAGRVGLTSAARMTIAVVVLILVVVGISINAIYRQPARIQAVGDSGKAATGEYRTRADAIRARGFDAGWLPPFTPPSATRLRYWMNQSSGWRGLICHVSIVDREALLSRGWTRADTSYQAHPLEWVPPATWWPKALRRGFQSDDRATWVVMLTGKRFKASFEYVAVNASTGEMATWIGPAEPWLY